MHETPSGSLYCTGCNSLCGDTRIEVGARNDALPGVCLRRMLLLQENRLEPMSPVRSWHGSGGWLLVDGGYNTKRRRYHHKVSFILLCIPSCCHCASPLAARKTGGHKISLPTAAISSNVLDTFASSQHLPSTPLMMPPCDFCDDD